MASVHNLDDNGGEVFEDGQTALVAGGIVFVNLAAFLVGFRSGCIRYRVGLILRESTCTEKSK